MVPLNPANRNLPLRTRRGGSYSSGVIATGNHPIFIHCVGNSLPAAGTWDFQPFWANPQGVRFEFAEAWYELFLHTAGRVMTLPYGWYGKRKFTALWVR